MPQAQPTDRTGAPSRARGRGLSALAVLACLAAALLLPSSGASAADRARLQTTTLITRALDGGLPNGPSDDAAISDDFRDASVLAFESGATNLVRARTRPGLTNVYFIRRRRPYRNDGSPWIPGRTVLASRGRAGAPANGSSFGAQVDGFNSYSPLGARFYAPHCVAFLSDASNLVGHDTNGRTDAFVYFLRTHHLERVSVTSAGRQGNGTTSAVSVNGNCSEVAFVSDSTNLARATHGRRQVYVRYLGGRVPGTAAPQPRRLLRRTVLVSTSRSGRPGNGDSFEPAFAKKTPGDLVFVSRATNLAAGTGGHAELYLHSDRRRSAALVTRAPGGQPGNGDSDQPAIQDVGSWIAFRTAATNLAGDPGGHTQIARTRVASHRFGFVSLSFGRLGNGDSSDPRITNSGYYVSFTTAASNLGTRASRSGPADTNGLPDVYLYTGVRNLTLRESVDSSAGQLSAPAQDAALSQFANYIFFDTSDPLADLRFAGGAGLRGTAGEAQGGLALRQIYMRYLGPE